jgi:outer membrane lipopolysaccharide assembly protein LptE/RlpB
MPETADTAELETLIADLIKQASSRLQRQFEEVHTRRAESAHDEALDLAPAQ